MSPQASSFVSFFLAPALYLMSGLWLGIVKERVLLACLCMILSALLPVAGMMMLPRHTIGPGLGLYLLFFTLPMLAIPVVVVIAALAEQFLRAARAHFEKRNADDVH